MLSKWKKPRSVPAATGFADERDTLLRLRVARPDETGLCFECDGVVIRSAPDPELLQIAADAAGACPDTDEGGEHS